MVFVFSFTQDEVKEKKNRGTCKVAITSGEFLKILTLIKTSHGHFRVPYAHKCTQNFHSCQIIEKISTLLLPSL